MSVKVIHGGTEYNNCQFVNVRLAGHFYDLPDGIDEDVLSKVDRIIVMYFPNSEVYVAVGESPPDADDKRKNIFKLAVPAKDFVMSLS